MKIWEKTTLLSLAIVVILGGLVACGKDSVQPPYNQTWISPAIVNVSNFHADGRAEANITIHNGNIEDKVDNKRVTTAPGETASYIPLNDRLFGSYTGIKLTTSIDEKLKVTGYDPVDNQIMIEGFLPDVERIMTITYPRYTTFSVTARLPDHSWEGFVDIDQTLLQYVKVSNASPQLAPGETRDILVALDVPKGVALDDKKVEFWISVMEAPASGVLMVTEHATRWLVKVK